MSKSEYINDSDGEELDEFELLRLEKWDAIKHYTLNDYMSCKQTKSLVVQQWNIDYEPVEKELEELYNKYASYMQTRNYDVLALSRDTHVCDFLSLIRHHIKNKYTTTIFEEDPDLAKPLIQQIEDIRKERELQRQIQKKEKLKQSNRTFNWNTKKYT